MLSLGKPFGLTTYQRITLQGSSLLWCLRIAVKLKLFPLPSIGYGLRFLFGLSLVRERLYNQNFPQLSLRTCKQHWRKQKMLSFHYINVSVQPLLHQSIKKSNCHTASLQLTHILSHSDADIWLLVYC